jgi:hypothetical protein
MGWSTQKTCSTAGPLWIYDSLPVCARGGVRPMAGYPQVGVNERRKKKWPRAWCSGLLWMVFDGPVAQESAGHKKTPCRSSFSGGGVSTRAAWTLATRRAYQQGGVSIAVLLRQGLLPDRSSCQDVFGFTDPTSFYMSHCRVGVKTSWVFFTDHDVY